MPSLSSPRVETGTFDCNAESVIVRSLLPFPALHAEPGNRDSRQQDRDHGSRYRSPLAEPAADDAALIAQGGHQMRGIDRTAARQRPDQLEVREREQDREGHD